MAARVKAWERTAESDPWTARTPSIVSALDGDHYHDSLPGMQSSGKAGTLLTARKNKDASATPDSTLITRLTRYRAGRRKGEWQALLAHDSPQDPKILQGLHTLARVAPHLMKRTLPTETSLTGGAHLPVEQSGLGMGILRSPQGGDLRLTER